MTKVAIIRCEKNEDKCPLTNCFRSMANQKAGFFKYSDCQLAGVFTCRCPGDNAVELAKILKEKGADVIHFCTCIFANKTKTGWMTTGGGFCDNPEKVIKGVHEEIGLPCIMGTAHLPKDYELQIWD